MVFGILNGEAGRTFAGAPLIACFFVILTAVVVLMWWRVRRWSEFGVWVLAWAVAMTGMVVWMWMWEGQRTELNLWIEDSEKWRKNRNGWESAYQRDVGSLQQELQSLRLQLYDPEIRLDLRFWMKFLKRAGLGRVPINRFNTRGTLSGFC